MINVPANIVTDLASSTSAVMSSVSAGIIFFIGLTAAFYSARELKRFFPKNGR